MGEAYIRRSKARVLTLLSRPGCMFCRQNKESLENFFFWYLQESYYEPENVRRMEESHGFCPAHTRELLSRGQPYTIASIYAPLLSTAVRELRGEKEIAERLSPYGECPACASIRGGREFLLDYLRKNLDDEEVCSRLREKPSICIDHLLEISPSLGWSELETLVGVVLEVLESLPERGLFPVVAGGVEAEEGPGLEPPELPYPERESWSPSLDELHALLRAGGCPVCTSQRLALAAYFNWLSREIREAPEHQWGEARWLCPAHLRRFVSSGEREMVLRLGEAIRGHWESGLRRLASGLEQRPPEHLISRLPRFSLHLREIREKEERRRPTVEVWEAVRETLGPPGGRLRTLRDSVLRRRSCPACSYIQSREERVTDLIWRSLPDPDTIKVYRRSHGLCLRHFPTALRLCENSESADLLVQDERTRLETLQWELREFWRKQSWNVRYEPKGGEGDAWRRVILSYSGEKA